MSARHIGQRPKEAKQPKTLLCPSCGSDSLRERERKRSEKAWQCRQCGKTTYKPRVKHSGPGSGVIAGKLYARNLIWGRIGRGSGAM